MTTLLDRPRLQLVEWRRVDKGALIGRAAVLLPNGMQIGDIGIFQKDGRSWAQLPSEPMRGLGRSIAERRPREDALSVRRSSGRHGNSKTDSRPRWLASSRRSTASYDQAGCCPRTRRERPGVPERIATGPGRKRPHTPRGFHDATRDPAIIGRLWALWPNALIGIPTGRASNRCGARYRREAPRRKRLRQSRRPGPFHPARNADGSHRLGRLACVLRRRRR